jgi:hypothetical protein
MRRGCRSYVATVILVNIATGSIAQTMPETDAFVNCVSENTTDEDKTAIVQLLTLAVATHPSSDEVVTIVPDARRVLKIRLASI